MINFCSTLLPNDRLHAIFVDIGKKTKPMPVIDKVIEFDYVPVKKNCVC